MSGASRVCAVAHFRLVGVDHVAVSRSVIPQQYTRLNLEAVTKNSMTGWLISYFDRSHHDMLAGEQRCFVY